MLKLVIALAGDVVEIGPEAVTVNRQPLLGTSSKGVDSLRHALPLRREGGTSSEEMSFGSSRARYGRSIDAAMQPGRRR